MTERTLKALIRDAKRYRFLRTRDSNREEVGVWRELQGKPTEWLTHGEVDRATDAAMRRVRKENK